MTTKNPNTVEEKLDAVLQEIEALRKASEGLAVRVENLEGLVVESHKILLAFSQSYYWTPEWQEMEARADEEARLGLGKVYESVEDLIKDLNK
jgi:hypothetical protein